QTGVPQEAEKDVAREPVELKGEEEERDRERGPQVEITVTDESGTKIRTFRAPARQGLNRAVWNLRRDAFREPPRERPEWMDDPSGPEVLPGTYGITIRYKDQTASGKVHVLPDPRFDIAPAARQANWAAMQRAGHLQETLAEAIDRINRTRNDIDAVIARRRPAPKPGERPAPDALSQEGRALKSRLDAVEKEFWVPPRTKGIQPDLDAFAKINFVQSSLASSWDAPTAAQLAYLKAAETKLQSALDALNKLFAEDVAKFREKVRASGLQLFPETKPLAITNEP
ncbi:MAG TPA: hypothetical protein VNL91_01385, partial [Thermoanaerobaculia bacterium]|nr:hypothetical protein [Thermoanaerobaculia bacterium]